MKKRRRHHSEHGMSSSRHDVIDLSSYKHGMSSNKHSRSGGRHGLSSSKRRLSSSEQDLFTNKHGRTFKKHDVPTSKHGLSRSKHGRSTSKHDVAHSKHGLSPSKDFRSSRKHSRSAGRHLPLQSEFDPLYSVYGSQSSSNAHSGACGDAQSADQRGMLNMRFAAAAAGGTFSNPALLSPLLNPDY